MTKHVCTNRCETQRKRFNEALGAKGYTHITIDICPALAQEMLKLNTNNRNLSQSKVAQLTDIIASGYWVDMNGHTIIFDEKKVMVSGQHRLHAFIEYGGVMKDVIVVTNADGRAKLVDDFVRAKTAKDVHGIAGQERKPKGYHGADTAAITKQIINGLNGSRGSIVPVISTSYSKKIHDGTDFAYEAFANNKTNASIAIAPIMAVAVRAFYNRPKSDRKKIKAFFDALCTGISQNPNLLQLRDSILVASKRNSDELRDIYRKVEAYLFDFLEGKDCSKVRASATERFPIWMDAVWYKSDKDKYNYVLVDAGITRLDEKGLAKAINNGKVRLPKNMMAKINTLKPSMVAFMTNGQIVGKATIKNVSNEPRQALGKAETHPCLVEMDGSIVGPVEAPHKLAKRAKNGALAISRTDFESIVEETKE